MSFCYFELNELEKYRVCGSKCVGFTCFVSWGYFGVLLGYLGV